MPAAERVVQFRASAASASRRCRSFSRQRRKRRRTDEGVSGRSACHGGSVFNTAASVSETVAPSNKSRPVSISQTITPNAHRSARLSTAIPRACSGAM